MDTTFYDRLAPFYHLLCATRLLRSRYDAVPIPRPLELMREAAILRAERRDGIFFQPLLIGVRDRADEQAGASDR